MRRARQEIEARTWDVFPNKETQRCFQSKTVLWKPITTNSPYGGARIVPLSPAGRVSEMLSPKLCHATTASPNGPIEPKPPKGSTDASQSKAVPKFIVIPMKVQNPRFWSNGIGDFCMVWCVKDWNARRLAFVFCFLRYAVISVVFQRGLAYL